MSGPRRPPVPPPLQFPLQPTHEMVVHAESDTADSTTISKVSTLQEAHDEKGASTEEVKPTAFTFPDGGLRAWLNIVGVSQNNF